MPTAVLPPGQHLRMNYGGARRGRAKVYVESSGPIAVYVTTLGGVQRFMQGQQVQPLYDFEAEAQVFNRAVALPRGTPWCLLLVNYSLGTDWFDACAVHYDVAER